jgi:TPR repeat protein
MNLEGSGITEDDYEALKWISLSANQGYPPAVKLLSHLLNTDFDMDC